MKLLTVVVCMLIVLRSGKATASELKLKKQCA